MQLFPTRPTKSWLVTEYVDGRPAQTFESVRHDEFVTKVLAALHGERFDRAAPSATEDPQATEPERLKAAA